MAYTAADILVRVEMSAATGLPEDTVVNTWAFKHDIGLPSEADLLNLQAAVDGWYNDMTGAVANTRPSYYISDYIPRTVTHQMSFYSIEDGGPPLLTSEWLGPAAAGEPDSSLPHECAAVLSFHADLFGIHEEVGITRPRARRRGRIYLGPLTPGASTGLAQATINPTLQQAMRVNANTMHDEALAADFTWCVNSRVDATLRPVVAGWTDNAFDTQRRRGMAATSRTAFGPV